MKFFSVILLVTLVALAKAEKSKKEIDPESAISVTEGESETNTRDRRSLFYGAYTAPIVTAPVAYATRIGYPYGALRYAVYGAYAPHVPAIRYL